MVDRLNLSNLIAGTIDTTADADVVAIVTYATRLIVLK